MGKEVSWIMGSLGKDHVFFGFQGITYYNVSWIMGFIRYLGYVMGHHGYLGCVMGYHGYLGSVLDHGFSWERIRVFSGLEGQHYRYQ